MNPKHVIALLALTYGSSALADGSCSVRPALSCPLPGKAFNTSDCPPEKSENAYRFRCLPTPPPAEIVCESAYGVVACEAWPQSQQVAFKYQFTPINGIEGGYSSSETSPFFVGNCTGVSGQIAVKVIAPDNTFSTQQVPFACMQDQ